MIIKYGFLSFLLLFLISSCTKISETDIGTGLIPPVDGVITKDTNITVYTKNVSDTDTVRPIIYDDHALGYVNDPLFGITTAAINVQMQPTSYPFYFEAASTSLMLDSVVLALDVRGSWGDTNQLLSLHVKEIDNDQPFIADDSMIHYTNYSQIGADNELTYNGLAKFVDPRTLNDSFHAYQDSGVNMLRIRLSDEFGNRLLHTFDSTKEYNSDSAFRVAFKGFQISADAISNTLLKIGLATSSGTAEANTKVGIYYRYTNSSGTLDTAVKYFTVNPSTSAHTNYIHRETSGAPIANYYPSNEGRNDDYVYLANNPNTFATISIDSAALRSLPNWIIHRAEIVMEQAPDAGSTMLDNFTTPYLFMVVKDSNNFAFVDDSTKFVIPGFETNNISTYDALFSSLILANYSDFGGVPLRKTNLEGAHNINYYNFNVSRYIQGILTNKNPQYNFTLYAPYREYIRLVKGVDSYGRVSSTPPNSAGIGRVRLYGGGDDVTNVHRMKLHIVYSIPH